MALTLAQLKTVALFGAGRTAATLPVGIDLVGLINDAGRQLVTERAWSFRKAGPVTLSAVAGQEYVDLPADFAEPLSVRGIGGLQSAQLVSQEEVTRMRQAMPTAGWQGTWYVAVSAATAAGATTTPARRLMVYPTPAANGDPALSLHYLTKWRTLTADDDVAAVPEEFEKALRYLVRAEIKRQQEDEHPPEIDWYAMEIDRLDRLEGRLGLGVVRIRGGAGEFRRAMGADRPDGGRFVWS